MKRLTFILVALALIAVPVLSACGQSGAPAQTIELTYNNFFPSTHFHSILADEFSKEIAKRTNGGVKITYYAGGSLIAADKTYGGIVDGIADIGMSVYSYTLGRFPATGMVDMPHSYPGGYVATMVANDFYQKFKPAELNDTHILYSHAHGPGLILTAKKPVRTLEDMKGLVIRSNGLAIQLAEALGASGYAAAQGATYELLSKGTIDGSYSPLEVLKGWKQAEVISYVTNARDIGYTANMFVTMNKNKWDSLPDNYKKIFTDVSAEWIEKHGMVWDYYDKVAKDYFLTFPGREVIELSPAEMDRWVKAIQPVKDKYMSDITAKGLDAKTMESYILERVKYWASKAPTADESVKWVQANVEPLAPAPSPASK